MRLLSHSDIWRVYSMEAATSDMEEAFQATTAGQVILPLRTRLAVDDRRTVLVMPAAHSQGQGIGVKTIALYPDNAPLGLPTAPASLLLLDVETGLPQALLDGETVTKIRTGASSAVALRNLALPDTEVGVVVGTGGQAFTQVLAMITALPGLRELRIVNPQPGLAQDFIERLQQWEPFTRAKYSGAVVAFTDADEAAIHAGAIILVTSSHQPVMTARNLQSGCVISCVGSYQPHMQECGADIIAAADLIVCDRVEAAVEESGDLIIPLRDGVITERDVCTEIGQILSGTHPGRLRAEDIIVYETVGVGSQDLWAARAIFEAAQRQNVGMEWDSLA